MNDYKPILGEEKIRVILELHKEQEEARKKKFIVMRNPKVESSA